MDDMKKKFAAIILVFLLSFMCISSTSAYASALPEDPVVLAEIINLADYSANVAQYQAECKAALNTMSPVAYSNASIVVGSAIFAYAATKGVEFAVDSTLETAATLGRWLIQNLSDLELEIQRYVVSTVLNCAESADYYESVSNVYSSQLLNQLDAYLGNYVDANVISMNEGLISQNVIPFDILSEMTVAVYNVYESLSRCIYIYNSASNALNTAAIYQIPDGVTKVVISNAGTSNFYTSDGSLVYTGSLPYVYYYGSEADAAAGLHGWYSAFWTVFAINGCLNPYVSIDWGGLEVLIGDSYATATESVSDFPLNLTGTPYSKPLVLNNDLVVPYSTALDVGTGSVAIDDVADVTVPDEPGVLDKLFDWLKSILQAILDAIKALAQHIFDKFVGVLNKILNAIETLASAIASAIGSILSTLFIPSEETLQKVKDLLDEKLPLINQLTLWFDSFNDVLNNPDGYASDLVFTVDFSKSDGSFLFARKSINMLNLTWYLKYKSMVDDIIVGIGWLIFLWNLYGQLPNIISAVGHSRYLDVHNDYILRERAEREERRSEWASRHGNKGGN